MFLRWVLLLPFLCLFLINTLDASKIPTAVLDLNEKFLDVMDNGFWFVKFYAPWCAHCKRLAPTWEHMGHALADRNSNIRVGKVDCTRFSKVGLALGINGYPTLIFFRNGVRIPYEGERQKEQMIQFAEKSAGPVVLVLETLNKYYDLKKLSHKDPFFVYVKNFQTNNDKDNSELLNIYKQIAEELFTEVRFLEAPQSLLAGLKEFKVAEPSTDVIFVVKNKRFVFFNSSLDSSKLREWIDAERWPLIPQINSANIYNIANSSRKKLVLMVGDTIEMIGRLNVSSDTGRFFAMFKKAAQLTYSNTELQYLFQYGWTDDVSLIKSVIMGEFALPNLIVFNLTSYEFYLNEDAPAEITENSMQTYLHTVAKGNVTVQGGRSWPTRLRRMVYEITSNIHDMFYHQPILTLCLFGVPLAFFSIIFYSVCSADFSVDRSEIYPDDEEEYEDYLRFQNKNDKNNSSELLKNVEDKNESSSGSSLMEEEEDEDNNSESELLGPKDSFQKKAD